MPALVDIGKLHGVRCIRPFPADVRVPPATIQEDGPRIDTADAVLELSRLSARYGDVQVLHSIDLTLHARECLALVGESGSGKTTTARAIAGLHRDWTGSIRLGSRELEPLARARNAQVRREIQFIFQNPYGSLNPRKSLGESLAQPLSVFRIADGRAAQRMVSEMLERVSLPPRYASRYPDQLSGGERQRVAIGRALISSPSVLICDEVTSALDVSVQAAIVDLLRGLQRDLGVSMIFVTHNLPLVRSIAQRVAVLAGGRVVEQGNVADLLDNPQDAYTRRLIADTPSLRTTSTALSQPDDSG
jgi:peptide/nickel transport system ATP-binding protein